MARLLRSTTKSFLRPPILTPAVVNFRGILVKHASVKPRADYSQRYFAHSKLRPPAAVSPAVVLYGPRVKHAPQPKQARRTHSQLRPPATLVAPVVPFIATPPRLSYKSAVARSKEQHFITSILWPPAVIDPLPPTYGPNVKLAPARKPPRTQANLRKPGVLGAAVVFRAIVVKHAAVKPRADYTQRHFARWRLRPPTVLFKFVASPILRLLAPSPRQARGSRGVVRPPAVVAASIVFRPIKRVLAWTFPRPAAAAHSELRPPTVTGAVVAAILAPIRVVLVAATVAARRPKYLAKLNAPTIVAASIVFAPVRLLLAPSSRLARKADSILRAPTVVGASIVFAPIRRYLAWQFPRPAAGTHSELRGPTVVAVFAFIAAPVKLVLVAVQVASKRRTYRSIIRPPAIVGAVAVALPIHLTLVAVRTAVDLIRRRPRSKLKPPTSVDPSIVFPPVDARLAPSGRQARATHSSLKGPTAISGAKIFGPVKAKLALQVPRQGRQTHSKLRLPVFKAPDLVAGAVAIVDTVLALVGLSDASSADVSTTDASGASATVTDTTASESVTVDGTGSDVTIIEPPR